MRPTLQSCVCFGGVIWACHENGAIVEGMGLGMAMACERRASCMVFMDGFTHNAVRYGVVRNIASNTIGRGMVAHGMYFATGYGVAMVRLEGL